jgi:hypothetical protein
MNRQDKMPILDVLKALEGFYPIKICFNDIVLYNDYDSTPEIEPGVFLGEVEPYLIAVPKRLKSALDNYDVFVTRFEVLPIQSHHSLVYLYGQKIRKGYFADEK